MGDASYLSSVRAHGHVYQFVVYQRNSGVLAPVLVATGSLGYVLEARDRKLATLRESEVHE